MVTHIRISLADYTSTMSIILDDPERLLTRELIEKADIPGNKAV